MEIYLDEAPPVPEAPPAPEVPLVAAPDVPLASEAPLVPLPDVPPVPDAPPGLLPEVSPAPVLGLLPEVPVVPVPPLEAAAPLGRFFALACFFALDFFFAFIGFSELAWAPVSPEAPEVAAPEGDAAISFACCSTAAAFAGSVLVVTPLVELCADVMPANDSKEIKRAKDTFFMLTSLKG